MFPKTLLVCYVRESVPRYSQVRSDKQSLYDAELDICSTKMRAQTSLFNCTDKFLTLTDTKKVRLPCTLIQ